MDQEAKAKLASRLSAAMHQALDHPENFANVLAKQLVTHGLHISDLRITFGDIDSYMAKQLQAARRNAPPTYANLIDIAMPKLSLKARTPERALGEALGVPLSEVIERKRAGTVPRIWFERVHALPEPDETTAELAPEVRRAVEALADDGFTPDEIHQVFALMRTTRISAKQITVLHRQNVAFCVSETESMRDTLFGHRHDKDARMQNWLATHLKRPVAAAAAPLSLSTKEADRLRERYKAEVRMRSEDNGYKRAAEAAELMPRPRRVVGHRGRSSGGGTAAVSAILGAVFGDQSDAATRLSQLTGLTARHALDLVKGSNNLPDDWIEFLDAVAVLLRHDSCEVSTELASVREAGKVQSALDLRGGGREMPMAAHAIPG